MRNMSTRRRFFLMTDGDWYVTPKYQRMVMNAYAGPKRVVHLKGNHNAAIDPKAMPHFQRALDWLWANLGKP